MQNQRSGLSINERSNKGEIYHDDDEDIVHDYEPPAYGDCPYGNEWDGHGKAVFEPAEDFDPEYVSEEAFPSTDILDENPDYLDYVSWTQTPKGMKRKMLKEMAKGGTHSKSKGKESRRSLTPSTFVNDGYNNNNSTSIGRVNPGTPSKAEEIDEDMSIVSYSPPAYTSGYLEGGENVEKELSMKEKYTSLRHVMKQNKRSKGSVGRASILSAPGNIGGEPDNHGKRLPWLIDSSRHGPQQGRRGSDGGAGAGTRSNFIWAVPYPGDYVDLGCNWLPEGPVTEL